MQNGKKNVENPSLEIKIRTLLRRYSSCYATTGYKRSRRIMMKGTRVYRISRHCTQSPRQISGRSLNAARTGPLPSRRRRRSFAPRNASDNYYYRLECDVPPTRRRVGYLVGPGVTERSDERRNTGGVYQARARTV